MALPQASFIWGANGAKLTPEEIAMQRALLARKGGIDTSPVGHWTQGAARVADAIAGAFQRGNLDKQEAANTAYDASLASPLADALAGGVAAYPSSVAAGGSATADAAVGMSAEAPIIKAKLIERGLPEHVADGFVANFADESGLNPGINEQNPTVAGSRGGYGLYQLTGPRRVAYESFAKERGVAPSDVDAQLDFLVSELKGPEAGAAAKIFAAPDSGTAAAAIATNFLRPNANSLAQRVAKYTSGVPQIPVQTASLDPSVGMATAYAPDATAVPPAAAAIEAVAPQFTPEQLASGNVANSPSMIPAPGAIPYTGPGAQVATPLPGADQGIGGVAYEQVPPVMPQQAQVAAGVPMVQPPADVSRVPALSGANGLPVVGPTGEPTPISGQARVAAALQAYPVQAQAAAGDKMVAGADQTLQPGAEQSGAFPAAPIGAPTNTAPVAQPGYLDASGGGQPQAQGNPIAAAVRAISDPRASPQTKAVAELVIKQAQKRQEAVADQQVWQQRQEYERTAQENDPKRRLEIQKLQREIGAPAERKTITVNGTVLDAQTMQPVYTAPEKPTSDIQEYEFAKTQGFKGSFVDFQLAQKKAGATSIVLPGSPEIGTIPQGYETFIDPADNMRKMRRIPGGPEDNSDKINAANNSKTITSDVVVNAAKLARDAIKTANIPATGTIGKLTAYLPESSAAELRRQVGVMKGTATIESLNAMRQQSPTGGALGNVTEGEGKMLAAKAGVLDPDSPNFQRDLDDYERTLLRIVNGSEAGEKIYNSTRDGANKDNIDDLVKKYGGQ